MFLGDCVYVLQILKTFCELDSSKVLLKIPYECQQMLFRQDAVNINWVNLRFYAQFVGSILMQSLMVFKLGSLIIIVSHPDRGKSQILKSHSRV